MRRPSNRISLRPASAAGSSHPGLATRQRRDFFA